MDNHQVATHLLDGDASHRLHRTVNEFFLQSVFFKEKIANEALTVFASFACVHSWPCLRWAGKLPEELSPSRSQKHRIRLVRILDWIQAGYRLPGLASRTRIFFPRTAA
jgi:hypothetical protein